MSSFESTETEGFRIERTQLFIGGKFCDAAEGGTFETINPATATKICDVSAATAADIDLAVQAATACLNSANWGYKSTGAQRAVVLRRLGELITEHTPLLTWMECLDNGKPRREAEADIGDAVTACSHFADLAEKQDRDQDEVIDNGTAEFATRIRYEPIGVVAAITPWNYPMLMAVWKVVPAIAAGCSIVLKPSELAPLSCLVLAELCQKAGLPDGALNVVPGWGHEAGAALTQHTGIDKISFTGSVPTAKHIMNAAAQGPRGLSLELGGKSPLIAFEDANLDALVDWILTGFLWGSGQVCSATSRVLLQRSIHDEVLRRMLEKIEKIKVCASIPGEQGPSMGPVVSAGQYAKIWALVDQARAALPPASLVCGGQRSAVAGLGGYFVPPTVFVDVPVQAPIWREEIFGPVLCVRAFDSEQEALSVANDSQYGLAGAVFSADAERCARVVRGLRCGVCWENNCQPAFVQCPWGGVKQSGFGRELGRWGLEEFTSVKQWTSCAPEHSWGLWG
ncbi:betaine aldehyde dehydrogenase [Ochromonadaceae sp. CCMP2298]|nr:betaine aldehyde dehydrogenase [Ochromonadaceae sp. CCMP2298]